jgi:hypothetical protein
MKMDETLAIFIAICFLIAIVVVWVGSIIYQNPPLNNVTTSVMRQCLPGQCVVNSYSGVKRCPTNVAEMVSANISYELCSSEFVCDNNSAPLAVDDRSVAIGGSLCPSDVPCQCLAGQYCGPDIMSYFVPFWSNQDPLIKYGQKTSVTDVLGTVHYTPPYYIASTGGSCTISPTLYANGALDTGSCLFGTLAYFPRAGATVGGLTTPLACVRGPPCPSGQGLSAVWNPITKSIVCQDVRDSVILNL